MPVVAFGVLQDLATRALAGAGANPAMAAATASALVYADARGLASHGVARVAQYATHHANGLAIGNSPAAMALAGGRRPLLGTNPNAAVFPRRESPALGRRRCRRAPRRPFAGAPCAIAAPGGVICP